MFGWIKNNYGKSPGGNESTSNLHRFFTLVLLMYNLTTMQTSIRILEKATAICWVDLLHRTGASI